MQYSGKSHFAMPNVVTGAMGGEALFHVDDASFLVGVEAGFLMGALNAGN
jgi:hypothetical protein